MFAARDVLLALLGTVLAVALLRVPGSGSLAQALGGAGALCLVRRGHR